MTIDSNSLPDHAIRLIDRMQKQINDLEKRLDALEEDKARESAEEAFAVVNDQPNTFKIPF